MRSLVVAMRFNDVLAGIARIASLTAIAAPALFGGNRVLALVR